MAKSLVKTALDLLPSGRVGYHGWNGLDFESGPRLKGASPMAEADAATFLKETPLFARLSGKELQAILRTSKEREFSAGSTIVREGETGGLGFYLILSGHVEVRKGEKRLAKLGAGEFFGEMALLMEDEPRSADVVALEDTGCVLFTRWDLRSLVASHPDIALKMLGALARRLRDTNRALSE